MLGEASSQLHGVGANWDKDGKRGRGTSSCWSEINTARISRNRIFTRPSDAPWQIAPPYTPGKGVDGSLNSGETRPPPNPVIKTSTLSINMYALFYLKLITSEDLLCSTGNSAPCYGAAWVGGEFGGEWIHLYVWLNLFAVHWKLPQHC